jgi:uncharacterized protein (TIGR03437 family)
VLPIALKGIAARAALLPAQPAGAFKRAGSMTTCRYGQTATLLNDGRVLVAGGFGSGFDVLANAEVYDPAAGTFTTKGSITSSVGAIAGRLAEILCFGSAPGYPGHTQVNFRIPSGIAPSPAATARVTYAAGRATKSP